jgi:hypothetical protein
VHSERTVEIGAARAVQSSDGTLPQLAQSAQPVAYAARMANAPALAPPPRSVPVSLATAVLLRGLWQTLGWIFTAVGVLVAGFVLRHAGPLFDDGFGGKLQTTHGVVTAVQPTSVRINSRRIHAVHFRWTDPRHGTERTGISYGRGDLPAVDSKVIVEVAAGNPPAARVQGLEATVLPALTHLLLVLPAIGLGMLGYGLLLGWRRLRLLQRGLLAHGRLVSRKGTATRVNNRRVYALEFAFVDATGAERRAKVRTHLVEALMDDAEEALLYDPVRPQAAALLDDLPARPTWSPQGELEPVPFGVLALALCGPTVVAVMLSVVPALASLLD